MNAKQARPAPQSAEPFHPAQRKLSSQKESKNKLHVQKFLPTLFDRLADHNPSHKSEASEAYALSRTDVRAIVQRDLGHLLNALNISDLLDESNYPEIASSTLNYGIPGFAGNYLSSKKWKDIERIIRESIVRFEPRIDSKSLGIKPLHMEDGHSKYNQLMFEISGWLLLQPYPLEFIVQSSVDMETNRFSFQQVG